MKIAIVKFAYQDYLRDYRRRFPEAANKSYAEQKRAYDDDAFWWGDSWRRALEPLGHDVCELVMNAESLQKAWAREHGMRPQQTGWMLPILRRQILEQRPEIVFVQSFRGFDVAFLRELRDECPSIRSIVGWCGSPLASEVFGACDVILSCVPEVVSDLTRAGHRAFCVNHAFDPRVLDRIDTAAPKNVPVSFVGSIENVVQHGERARFLAAVAERVPLHVYTFQRERAVARLAKTMIGKVLHAAFRRLVQAGVPRARLHALPVVGVAAGWSGSPRYRPAPVRRRFLREPVYGLPMFQTLRDSEVTLNLHSSISPRSASNLRLFEAIGVGACLVTDWKENLGELFSIDEEVVTFRTPEECASKVKWLLEHPTDRERVARAGQARALREHTFAERAPVLDRLFRSL